MVIRSSSDVVPRPRIGLAAVGGGSVSAFWTSKNGTSRNCTGASVAPHFPGLDRSDPPQYGAAGVPWKKTVKT